MVALVFGLGLGLRKINFRKCGFKGSRMESENYRFFIMGTAQKCSKPLLLILLRI